MKTSAAAKPSNSIKPDATPPKKPAGRILVVEDSAGDRKALLALLDRAGHHATAVESADKAMGYLDERFDVVLADLYLGEDESGINLLEAWKNRRSETEFIVMTGNSSIETAVEAMRKGALHYLVKPLNTDELMILVERAIRNVRQGQELNNLRKQVDKHFGVNRIIGQSKIMRDVFARIERAAPVDSTVLILGESGTGKELVAEGLHQNSNRRGGPFVAINIAAVPDTLVESELFGHVEGAFTGAMKKREGRFEEADGGTLFIDEVGDFGLSLQAKLLRVLETLTLTPVGGQGQKKVDVRVVAATSRDLKQMVRDGTFREDLFYRLNVIPITLPPLRDRPEDVPLLVEHFLNDISGNKGVDPKKINPDVIRAFQGYGWPGNVRELRNMLETMMVMAEGDMLQLSDLPDQFAGGAGEPGGNPTDVPSNMTMDELERLAINKALDQCGGNRTHAAQKLDISVRTLQRKLRQYEAEQQASGRADRA
jgi:DNA-binding NtrC family response regulator